ncbi:MAG: hypothetical protein GXO69_11445, partial [Acidobacteria bacterium]|nr:hypothetical protein [Acidobacteriota bacterium]
MSETEALNYFFTTTDGQFTADTTIAHQDEWPNVSCIACHDQHNPGKPAYFNSSTGEHQVMENNSQLCGQCHGNLRFPDTDHVTYNTWAASKHNDTQNDVADELGEERAGQTPDEVVN